MLFGVEANSTETDSVSEERIAALEAEVGALKEILSGMLDMQRENAETGSRLVGTVGAIATGARLLAHLAMITGSFLEQAKALPKGAYAQALDSALRNVGPEASDTPIAKILAVGR